MFVAIDAVFLENRAKILFEGAETILLCSGSAIQAKA
jgi:hypothetical protein